MLEKLMPRADEFFDDFEKLAAATIEGARLLLELLNNGDDIPNRAQAIKAVEHRGDEITHRAITRLHTQFITPFDRGEIHRLLSRIDDVLDLTDAASERLALYELTPMLPDVRDLADVLLRTTMKMQEAVRGLRNVKQPAIALQRCREVNELENEGDRLLRRALADLFKSGRDPLTVMMWKEILDYVEQAIDRAEDVANVIEGVVLEHA
jgi:predicted phosphate transport protein (TIGR00153 family)